VNRRGQISVEVDHDAADDVGGRSWLVTLRRGQRAVVVGRELGRFAAIALGDDLRRLLGPRARQEGGAID
jgi:hypothetical protein